MNSIKFYLAGIWFGLTLKKLLVLNFLAFVLVAIIALTGINIISKPSEEIEKKQPSSPANQTNNLPLINFPSPSLTPINIPNKASASGQISLDDKKNSFVKPLSLTIPKISIDTSIVEVGYVPETQAMEVPADASQVGWYKYGPSPGTTGSSLLSGHFDTPTGAPAIFYNLSQLKVGDYFYITNDHEEQLRYVVDNVFNLPLDNFPKDLLYGEKETSRVSLITCAGVWNPQTKLYSKRLAVIGKLDAVYPIAFIAPVEKVLETYLQEPFLEESQTRTPELDDSYLRLSAKSDRIVLYMATDNLPVISAEAILGFDPSQITINQQAIAFSNQFEVHFAQVENSGQLRISLFSDSQRSKFKAINTGDKEIKLAEIFFQKKPGLNREPEVRLIKDKNGLKSSLLLYQKDQEIHQAKNILKSVSGTKLNP